MIVIAPNVRGDIVGRAETLRGTLDKSSTRALPGYEAYLEEMRRRIASNVAAPKAPAAGPTGPARPAAERTDC